MPKNNTITKEVFSVSIDKDLFKTIEEKRGLIPRSPYTEFLLKKILIEDKNDL